MYSILSLTNIVNPPISQFWRLRCVEFVVMHLIEVKIVVFGKSCVLSIWWNAMNFYGFNMNLLLLWSFDTIHKMIVYRSMYYFLVIGSKIKIYICVASIWATSHNCVNVVGFKICGLSYAFLLFIPFNTCLFLSLLFLLKKSCFEHLAQMYPWSYRPKLYWLVTRLYSFSIGNHEEHTPKFSNTKHSVSLMKRKERACKC